MSIAVSSLVEALRKGVPMVVRTTAASNDYLEGVFSRQDLKRCHDLLSETLGPPMKDFGEVPAFSREVSRVVNQIGGIRVEQCLFFKAGEQGQVFFAALWPWASDPTRITLKVGVLQG